MSIDNFLNPKEVVTLIVGRCEFNNGTEFTVVTDLPSPKWEKIQNEWLEVTKKYTMEDCIEYVKSKYPYCIIMPKADLDKIPHKVADHKEITKIKNN